MLKTFENFINGNIINESNTPKFEKKDRDIFKKIRLDIRNDDDSGVYLLQCHWAIDGYFLPTYFEHHHGNREYLHIDLGQGFSSETRKSDIDKALEKLDNLRDKENTLVLVNCMEHIEHEVLETIYKTALNTKAMFILSFSNEADISDIDVKGIDNVMKNARGLYKID